MTTAQRMRDAAGAFLESLGPDQRAAASFPFPADEVRRDWHYIPRPRAGLPLAQMDATQRRLAQQLLASGTSRTGYAKASAIIALENVLREIEGERAVFRRDDLLYFVCVFGEPGSGAWGWRFEGHHLSVNVTVADDVVGVPMFFGANPAIVRHDGVDVLHPLREEEEVARALLATLDGSRRASAVISDRAPDDILTEAVPRLDDGLLAGGVAAAELDSDQRGLLARLVRAYVERAPADVAQSELGRIGIDSLVFAWAGSAEPGRPHYYRVAGPRFLAEYDNTQDGANHIHAVWRDPSGDFGDDLLRAHRARQHT